MKFKLTKRAVARLLLFIASLINLVLVGAGFDPLEINNDTITEIASWIFVAGSGLWGYWKNNSATHGAKKGDEVKDLINGGDLVFAEKIEKLIEEADKKGGE